jgi:hypothetical protein
MVQVHGSYEESRALHQEGLSLFEEIGDTIGSAWSLGYLGHLEFNRDSYPVAQVFLSADVR